MKIHPTSLAKIIGLAAGTYFGGPLLVGLGAHCGSFVGQMFADADDGGWELGKNTASVLGNIFAGRYSPVT